MRQLCGVCVRRFHFLRGFFQTDPRVVVQGEAASLPPHVHDGKPLPERFKTDLLVGPKRSPKRLTAWLACMLVRHNSHVTVLQRPDQCAAWQRVDITPGGAVVAHVAVDMKRATRMAVASCYWVSALEPVVTGPSAAAERPGHNRSTRTTEPVPGSCAAGAAHVVGPTARTGLDVATLWRRMHARRGAPPVESQTSDEAYLVEFMRRVEQAGRPAGGDFVSEDDDDDKDESDDEGYIGDAGGRASRPCLRHRRALGRVGARRERATARARRTRRKGLRSRRRNLNCVTLDAFLHPALHIGRLFVTAGLPQMREIMCKRQPTQVEEHASEEDYLGEIPRREERVGASVAALLNYGWLVEYVAGTVTHSDDEKCTRLGELRTKLMSHTCPGGDQERHRQEIVGRVQPPSACR
eukprot:jgi/Mesvir1/27732/Mv07428-RA.1